MQHAIDEKKMLCALGVLNFKHKKHRGKGVQQIEDKKTLCAFGALGALDTRDIKEGGV